MWVCPFPARPLGMTANVKNMFTQTMLIMSMIMSSTTKVGAKTLNRSGFLHIDRWHKQNHLLGLLAPSDTSNHLDCSLKSQGPSLIPSPRIASSVCMSIARYSLIIFSCKFSSLQCLPGLPDTLFPPPVQTLETTSARFPRIRIILHGAAISAWMQFITPLPCINFMNLNCALISPHESTSSNHLRNLLKNWPNHGW